MNREIVWTAQFKKDDKLAMKRHMDMDLLDHIIRALSGAKPCRKETKTIASPAIGWGTENVIFSRIGFWPTAWRRMCWC